MGESKSIIKMLFDARFEELSYLTEEDKNYIIENENETEIDSIFLDLDGETRERIKELRYIKQVEVLFWYCECGTHQEKYSVAMNQYAIAEILEKLVHDESDEVAKRALQNPNVSCDLLRIYQHSEQYGNRKAVAMNPSITEEMMNDFSMDSDFKIVNALHCNPAVNEVIIQKIYDRIVELAIEGDLFGNGREDLLFQKIFPNDAFINFKDECGRNWERVCAIRECLLNLIKNPRTPKSIIDELEELGYNSSEMSQFNTVSEY